MELAVRGDLVRRGRRVLVVGALVAGLIGTSPVTAAGQTPDAPAAVLEKPRIPTTGAYFGVATHPGDGETRLEALDRTEDLIDRTMGISRQFYRWDGDFPSEVQDADKAAGRIPHISWRSEKGFRTPTTDDDKPVKWARIIAGEFDKDIRRRAKALKAFQAPLFFTFMHEPYEASACKGNKSYGTPAEYQDAWRHIVDIFRDVGANNVAFVYVVTAFDYRKTTGREICAPTFVCARAFYPGDDHVDWIAADPFNWFERDGTWDPIGSVPGMRQYLKFGAAHGKPLMLAEWATTEDEGVPGRKAEWIADAQAWISDHPEIKAAVYYNNLDFDYAGNGPFDWRIDTSPGALDAIKTLAADPYFGEMESG